MVDDIDDTPNLEQSKHQPDGYYFYEFLIRGHPPEGEEPLAYHLAFANPNANPQVRMFNMQQASDAGWTLPEIFKEVNQESLKQLDTYKILLDAIIAERNELRDTILALQSQIDELTKLVEQPEPPPPTEGE